MERILNCILSFDSISPETPIFCGMQGEHRATALVMTPDDAFLSHIESRTEAGFQVYCRTDIHTPSGECIKGEEMEVSRISEPFWLTSDMTSSGLEITAVFHLILRKENSESEMFKAQFPLIFEASPINCGITQNKKTGIERIEEKTQEAVKLIDDRLIRAEELISIKTTALSKRLTDAANAVKRAEKLVEYAENSKEILSSDTEYVFLGGDATHSVSAELIVDEELTDFSSNAVQSKAIFEAIREGQEKTAAETDDKLETAMSDAIKAAVSQAVAEAKLSAHPVGSLYWSEDSTNPAELFGGTWERVKDKFILAAGDEFSSGDSGGEAEVTLTVETMPNHSHVLVWDNEGAAASGSGSGVLMKPQDSDTLYAYQSGYAGEGKPHNNMPPYEVYYCFKRTA